MNNEFFTIPKGALLHDIGKVVQRASENPTSKKHSQWGYDWLIKHNFREEVALASLAHHYHEDYTFKSNISLIWYQADNLASGERKKEDKDFEEAEWHKEVLLASPFFRVRDPVELKPVERLSYLSLKKDLTVETVIYDESESPASQKEYESLLKNFEEDLKFGKENDYPLDFLLMLYQKHFSSVPSITSKVYERMTREEIKEKHPDISLYDHSKLTAAIAGCMYHYYRETYPQRWEQEVLKDEILEIPQNTKPYLLIGGDISGIQKFIYTITSKGALKSLKGRSFYLELLTEHIISELIKALNLSRCNIIFAGGGHFYILSHSTPSAYKAIGSVKEKINRFLLNEFQGELQVHIAYEPFHPDVFTNKKDKEQDVSSLWSSLTGKLEGLKKKKWEDHLHKVLEVKMSHTLTDSCEICFRDDILLRPLVSEDEEVSVCQPCFDQFHLGKMLLKFSKKDYPVIYKFGNQPDVDNFIKIDNRYYVFGGYQENLAQEAETIYRINDFEPVHYTHPEAVHLPLGIYQHHNMEELSDVSSIYGIKRIGVLRMDVDNLGKIFSQTVDPEDRTFSRMAVISRRFNEFFKYYLNNIVEAKEIDSPVDIADRGVKNTGRKLSIVYSGGDDLFIIGHWLEVIEASIDINRYFRKFTGNPYITISGGIAINYEKYPVYQFARDAGKAEEKAKEYREDRNDRTKNAILFFKDLPFKWSHMRRVLEKFKLFTGFLDKQKDHFIVNERKLPKTFFYRLLSLARRFRDEKVLILPKAAYLISRAKFEDTTPEEELKLKEVIMTTNEFEWKVTEAVTLLILMMMRGGE